MRAVYCPECKAEYRPGFTHCVDCDVDLVEALRPDDESQSEEKNLKMIWAGTDEGTCLAFCSALKKQDILYKVWQGLKSRGTKGSVTFRYAIGVPEVDAARAWALWDLPEAVAEEDEDSTGEDEDENQVLLEYPEGSGSDPDEPRRRRDYLRAFYPEDAAVEIYQAGFEGDSGVQAALKENYIRVRVEPQPDGSNKLFVLPEDEAAAREIVREIVGDSPYP